MKPCIFVSFVIILIFSQQSFAYFSGQGQGGSVAKTHNQQKNSVSMRVKNSQQAAKLVKSRFGGKVLKVNKNRGNGHVSYRVKLVKTNGHVISVVVDAKTGKLLGN